MTRKLAADVAAPNTYKWPVLVPGGPINRENDLTGAIFRVIPGEISLDEIPTFLCKLARVELGDTDLGAPRGRRSAMIAPNPRTSRLRILVDSRPNPGQLREAAGRRPYATPEVRRCFRVLHELVHTFFYSEIEGGPVRIAPPTRAEEDFCDRVASRVAIQLMRRRGDLTTASDAFAAAMYLSGSERLAEEVVAVGQRSWGERPGSGAVPERPVGPVADVPAIAL